MPWGAPSFVSLPNKKQHQLKTTTKKQPKFISLQQVSKNCHPFFFPFFGNPNKKPRPKMGGKFPPFGSGFRLSDSNKEHKTRTSFSKAYHFLGHVVVVA